MKRNQATLLLGLLPSGQGQLGKAKLKGRREGTELGDKGESCKRRGFMPHYTQAVSQILPGAPQLSRLILRSVEEEASTLFSLLTGAPDPAADFRSFRFPIKTTEGPGSPKGPPHTPGPMPPPSLCSPWHPLHGAAFPPPAFHRRIKLPHHS